MSDQTQLWDAGPVLTGRRNGWGNGRRRRPPGECAEDGCTKPRRSGGNTLYCEDHARGSSYHQLKGPVPCREPDCDKPRREVQGAVYCEDHARGKDYKLRSTGPPISRACHCGREFVVRRRVEASEAAGVWLEFCQDCRRSSQVTREQLVNHRVPAALARQWIAAGTGLLCEFCGRHVGRIHGKATVIDHDHGCCDGTRSCGHCIRGPVHHKCNIMIGYMEAVRAAGLLDRAADYLQAGYLTAVPDEIEEAAG